MKSGADLSTRFPIPPLIARRSGLILTSIALAFAGGMLFFFSPSSHGFYPRCLLYTTTGLWCPGCGGLRATHEMLHGNLHAAFTLNPLVFLALPGALLWFLDAWISPPCGDFFPRFFSVRWVLPAMGVLLVLYGIARNWPGFR